MSGKLILVTGGSRSGKSEFAEEMVRYLGKSCAYIATAEICDEEMQVRVEKHRARREDAFWQNFEAPKDAHDVIKHLDKVDSVLFDCITIYLTNFIYSKHGVETLMVDEQQVFAYMNLLLTAARQSGKNVVFVTNELGSGLVPFDTELRSFRDIAGYVNQFIAQQMDEVYLVVCGIAVNIKKLAVKLNDKGKI